MEETKLDKAVDKLFRFTEVVSRGVERFSGSRSMHIANFCVGLWFLSLGIFELFFSEDATKWDVTRSFLIGFWFLHNTFVTITLKLQKIGDIERKIIGFAGRFYSDETIQFCFKPLIADWRRERKNSLEEGRNWQANWISVRYFWAFLWAIIQQSRIGKLFELIFR